MDSGIYINLAGFISFLVVCIPIGVFFFLIWEAFSAPPVCVPDSESVFVEFIWTVIPSTLIFVLCVLNLFQLLGQYNCHGVTSVNVVGHQWYWEYEGESAGESYDSLVSESLFSVDKPLRLILGKAYQLVVTSNDVLHSFSVPALGVKLDAIPGRACEVVLLTPSVGVFHGYCAELCGAGHSYMPIVVEVVEEA